MHSHQHQHVACSLMGDGSGHTGAQKRGSPLKAQDVDSANTSWRSLFESIDVNDDKNITLKEWIQAFDRVDTNHNGVISRKEWCLNQGDTYVFDAIWDKKNLAALSRDEWKRTFGMLDSNKDGKISLEEWLSPGMKGRTVYFDLHDCRDIIVFRSLKLQFDKFGARVLQAKKEINNQRLYVGDRIISINNHFLYGATREDIEYQYRFAKDGRKAHITFEDRPHAPEPSEPPLGRI